MPIVDTYEPGTRVMFIREPRWRNGRHPELGSGISNAPQIKGWKTEVYTIAAVDHEDDEYCSPGDHVLIEPGGTYVRVEDVVPESEFVVDIERVLDSIKESASRTQGET